MRLFREFRSAAWSVLIVAGLCGLSGCEEELPPIVDIDTPFARLLTNATDKELCEFTYYKICNRYDFYTRNGINVEVERYSPEERMVILVWHTSDCIVNGGFGFMFTIRYDEDPDFQITEDHFDQLGLDEQKKILVEARKLAPDNTLPETPKEREELMEGLGKEVVEPYDFRFRDACESGIVVEKLAAFIRKNAEALSHLDQPQ